MASSASSLDPYRPLILLGAIVLVTATLYWAQQVLIPIALAILLTFCLSPLAAFLQRRGLWRVPAVLLVTCFSFVVLAGIAAMLTLQLRQLALELPGYRTNLSTKIANLRNLNQGTWLHNLEDMIQEVAHGDSQEQQQANIPRPDQPPAVQVQPPGTFSIEKIVGPTLEFLAMTGLVVVLVVFMLIQREDLRNRLVKLIGHGRLIHTTRAFEDAAHRLSRFLLMQLFVNVGVGTLIGLSLFFVGIPYPLLWGILVAVLRFIPYVGIWVAFIPILLVTVAVTPGWTELLLILGLMIVVELLVSNVVEPLVFGHSTGVSPVALLLAAAFWTWLWGPIGLVLSTPMTACLVVLGRHVPYLHFLGVLLGDKGVVDSEIVFYQRLLARDEDEARDVVREFVSSHPVESVYDEILAPALVLARRDRYRGELQPDDEKFILETIDDIVDDLSSSEQLSNRSTETTSEAEPIGAQFRMLACPASDKADEIALKMLLALIHPSRFEMEVISSQVLAAEVVARIEQEGAPLVCIGALPPGGVAQARYLCKRLRASFPELKIVVVRWGLSEHAERRREELLAAGADAVASSLGDARDKTLPLLTLLAHATHASTIPAPERKAV